MPSGFDKEQLPWEATVKRGCLVLIVALMLASCSPMYSPWGRGGGGGCAQGLLHYSRRRRFHPFWLERTRAQIRCCGTQRVAVTVRIVIQQPSSLHSARPRSRPGFQRPKSKLRPYPLDSETCGVFRVGYFAQQESPLPSQE